jgi:hypothetical protein
MSRWAPPCIKKIDTHPVKLLKTYNLKSVTKRVSTSCLDMLESCSKQETKTKLSNLKNCSKKI